jgi:hypothetical protein
MRRRQLALAKPASTLEARLAALLGAIPPAFPPALAAESSDAAATAADVCPGERARQQQQQRQRRSLSNATAGAWQAQLGAAEQQMQRLAVGRTRSEPVVAAALPPALASSPAPAPAAGSSSSTGSPPQAGADQQPDRPGSGGRLQRSMRQQPWVDRSGRPLRPAAPTTRRRSATPESSARHTPFAVSPVAAGPPPGESSPAGPAYSPAARPATSPSQRQCPQRPRPPPPPGCPTTSPSPRPPAAAPQPPAAQLPVNQQLLAPEDEEGGAIDLPWAAASGRPALLSSLPRRLLKDLLALLLRQRNYLGARHHVGAGMLCVTVHVSAAAAAPEHQCMQL